MGKQEVPKPLLLALVAVAIGAGAYFFLGKSSEEVPPPPPVTAATGATGSTGASGPTGNEKTAAELRAERRKKLVEAANVAGVPVDVFVARKRGKKVLIFFWEPKGEVDQETNASVKGVKSGDGKVVVFREKIANKTRYDGIAEAAKVTGTPAIVVLYRDRALLIEGYVSRIALEEQIAQLVKD